MKILSILFIVQGLLAADVSEVVKIFRNHSGVIENPGVIKPNTYYNFTIVPFRECTVQLKTQTFSLIRSNKYGECQDFVKITKIPGSNSEDKRYCGEREFEKYLTADRIFILFKKESNNDESADFRITYKACSSEMSGSNGSITTHPFKASNGSKHLRCFFAIDSGTSSPLLIHIKDLPLNENTNCTSYIQISGSNQSQQKLCRSIFQQSFFFEKGPIQIIYNGKGNVNGFNASYAVTSKGNFSQLLQGRNGSFSPNLYSGHFVNNAEYVFNITTGDHGGKIIMCFEDSDFDSNCRDYIVVYYNDMKSMSKLCAENITSAPVALQGNSAMVSFLTDFEGSGQGFRGHWSTCGGQLTEPEGFIFPPYDCNSTKFDLECLYEIDAAKTENVFITYHKLDGFDQGVSSHKSAWIPDYPEIKDGTWVIKTNSTVIAQYLVSPRVYSERTGTITLESHMADAISPGKNCTFVINAGETDIIHFNMSLKTTSSNCSDNILLVGLYPMWRTQYEYRNISDTSISKRDLKSFGPVSITYSSVKDRQIAFEVEFYVQKGTVMITNFDNSFNIGQLSQKSKSFWRKMLSSDLLIPVIASTVGIIIVLAVIVAVAKYRKKKKNANNELVWLTDKATSTLERSFVPFLPELDKLSLNNEERGEIIVGLGGYAEVIFPEKKGKVYPDDNALNPQARKVSTFSLKRTNSLQIDTSIDSSTKNEEVRCRNEYSTPWDAKSEKDKIIKVMSLQYREDKGVTNTKVRNDNPSAFQYSHTSGTTFGIPCTEGTDNTNSKNNLL